MADKDDKSPSQNNNTAQDPSRRKFLKNTGIATGGVVGGVLLGGLIGTPFKSDEKDEGDKGKGSKQYSEARMFFTRYEDFVILEQATERIYPEDDNGPGAIELGVPYFIDKQLAGTWGKNTEEYMMGPFAEGEPTQGLQSALNRGEIFTQGIRKIKEISNDEFDSSFEELEEEQQNEILKMFENGDVELGGVPAATFFDMLIKATIEGAYSDPLYGGNRNMAGWKMREYPGPQSSYLNYIEEEDFIEMDPISLSDYNN